MDPADSLVVPVQQVRPVLAVPQAQVVPQAQPVQLVWLAQQALAAWPVT